MRELFTWCVDQDVPILAHSLASNGPFPEFRALAGPSHWRDALGEFENLRVNFGHFGGAGGDGSGFLNLLEKGPSLFADASYFNELLDDEALLRREFQKLFAADNAKVLPDRLLYGSDWKMLASEKDSDTYLARFEEFIVQFSTPSGDRAAQTAIGNQVFGSNSAKFLGLFRDDANRGRLNRFYEMRDVKTPVWMPKVDKPI